jgi:hypothetical protein
MTAPTRLGRVALLVLFVTAYALLGRGTFFTSDEGGIFNTTLALLQRRTLAVGPGENIHPGADGRLYACREILPTAAAVPFALGGMLLNAMTQHPPPVAPYGGRLDGTNWPIFVTVTLLGPLAVAATLLLLREFVLDDGGTGGEALGLALAAGLATPLAVYAKTIFPQVFESAFLMLAVWACLRWRQTGDMRAALAVGVACGLGLMTRAAFLPLLGPFAAYLVLARPGSVGTRASALLVLGVPAAAGAAVTAWVNWLRWGSPLDFGYHNPAETFSTPALAGLYGLLASPGKGLFVYAPLLMLAVAFTPRLWRRGPAEVLLLLAVTACYLAVYCRWYDWPGGLAWGPRFLVPLMAPWVALLGRTLTPGATAARVLLAVLSLAGLAVEVPGIMIHPKCQDTEGGGIFEVSRCYPLVLARLLGQSGANDLWLWPGPGPVTAAFWPLVIVFAGAALVSAALLWRRAGRSEKAAVLAVLALVALLVGVACLRR